LISRPNASAIANPFEATAQIASTSIPSPGGAFNQQAVGAGERG
jgi:hypothetical protein